MELEKSKCAGITLEWKTQQGHRELKGLEEGKSEDKQMRLQKWQ